MIKLATKQNCCGCTACESVCSHKAIVMREDGMGFRYPEVDTNLCVECGLCVKVCAFNDSYDTRENLSCIDAYAVRHKDMGEVESSRSGAMFVAVADWVLARSGVVYGVGFDDDFMAVHKRAENKIQCREFKGSKYVQSRLSGCFEAVARDLKHGRDVLFTGTACQCSGLRSFLDLMRVDSARLIVCDIVCHGVPSSYVWRDYLRYLEAKNNAKIVAVNFRDKSRDGWSKHFESFRFDNGRYLVTRTFRHLFLQDVMLRPSCGQCHFANLRRPSDITLADYWGWQKLNPKFNADDKGVSLVLVSTAKGHQVFDQIKDGVHYIEAQVENCLQPNLQRPARLSPQSQQFAEDFLRHDFEYVRRKYGDYGLKYRIEDVRRAIKISIKKIFRK